MRPPGEVGAAGAGPGCGGAREGAAGRRAGWARGPAGAEAGGAHVEEAPAGAWGGRRALRAAEVRVGSQAGRTRKGAALRTPQVAAEGSAPACSPESQGLRVTLGLAVRILERTGLGRVRPEVPPGPDCGV